MPPDVIEIEVSPEGDGLWWVNAKQRTGGSHLVSARLKVEDIGPTVAAAVEAYYSVLATVSVASGARIVDERSPR
jgi:hypothetical protein